MEPWILHSIRTSWRRMSGRQFVTSSSSTLGLCSRTMIPNTPASPTLNGSRKTKLMFSSGQVKIWLRYCGMTLNTPFILENPENEAEFHVVPGRFGQLFSLSKLHFYIYFMLMSIPLKGDCCFLDTSCSLISLSLFTSSQSPSLTLFLCSISPLLV